MVDPIRPYSGAEAFAPAPLPLHATVALLARFGALVGQLVDLLNVDRLEANTDA